MIFNTKKKILLSILAISVGVFLLTGCSKIFAVNEETIVQDTYSSYSNVNVDNSLFLSNDTILNINKGGEYYISGAASECSIIIDTPDNVVLNLDSIYIQNKKQSAIIVKKGNVTLNILDETMSSIETLQSSYETYRLIDSQSDIYVKGRGFFKLENKNGDIIRCKNLDVDETSLFLLESDNNGVVAENVTVNNSYIYLNNIKNAGIWSDNFDMNGGDLHINSLNNCINSSEIYMIDVNLFLNSNQDSIMCNNICIDTCSTSLMSKDNNIYAKGNISIVNSICFFDNHRIYSEKNEYIYLNNISRDLGKSHGIDFMK